MSILSNIQEDLAHGLCSLYYSVNPLRIEVTARDALIDVDRISALESHSPQPILDSEGLTDYQLNLINSVNIK